jgi:hypothetical protein
MSLRWLPQGLLTFNSNNMTKALCTEHARCAAQALCSACAKMCVRELRAEHPNVSVFYMAWVSLVAALIGCFLPKAWGDTNSFRVPDHWAQWTLLVGIGMSPTVRYCLYHYCCYYTLFLPKEARCLLQTSCK